VAQTGKDGAEAMAEEDFAEQNQDNGKPRLRLRLRHAILMLAAAFLLGAAAVGWFVSRGGSFGALRGGAEDGPIMPALSGDEATGDTAVDSEAMKLAEVSEDAVEEAVEVVEKVAQAQGGFDHRLAGLEQRLARLDLQAQAAAGNAARAEGLLIAFATRRAIERGAPLGYLADQLRLRFGDARPNAVRTVIEFSREPVTLDQLLARLEGLGPQLTKAPEDEGAWSRIKREVNGLFVIRRESAPSPAPLRRLERARLFLESGRIEAAMAEVRNMPGAPEAKDWLVSAERFAAAQAALDLIETTAVLEPRDLRDGRGNKVEQLSPASGA